MLQNRVSPWGELCAVATRGTLMGNRGILHDERKQITRKWAHQNWVICKLEFGSIKRPKPFSTLDNYSELFFLDEATAFAAGHRPCNFCQRKRSQEFKSLWLIANIDPDQRSHYKMAAIDKHIHAERAFRSGVKRTYRERVRQLPVGTFFEYQNDAYLVTACGYRKWAFESYGPEVDLQSIDVVDVLTPGSIVRTFSAGFVPSFHCSAELVAVI